MMAISAGIFQKPRQSRINVESGAVIERQWASGIISRTSGEMALEKE